LANEEKMKKYDEWQRIWMGRMNMNGNPERAECFNIMVVAPTMLLSAGVRRMSMVMGMAWARVGFGFGSLQLCVSTCFCTDWGTIPQL
jgi:hypothetical protein